MAFIVTIAAWSSLSPPLCEATVFTDALEHKQATWCFEFWANRYQTAFTGLCAIAAAFAAWLAVNRQIASNEAAITIARQQAAAASLEHLASRREFLHKARSAVYDCSETISNLKEKVLADPKAFVSDGNKPREAPPPTMNLDLVDRYAERCRDQLLSEVGTLEFAEKPIKDLITDKFATRKSIFALREALVRSQRVRANLTSVQSTFKAMAARGKALSLSEVFGR
jgi:hypothetical protein